MPTAITTVSSYISPIWETVSSAAGSARDKCVQLATQALDFVAPQNPVTHNREIHLIPEFVETALGSVLYSSYMEDAGGKVHEDDAKYGTYVKMVKEIGVELAAHSPRKGLEFEFNVVRKKTDNAWCLPGGKIAINIGIIKKMEAEAESFGLQSFSLREKIAAVLSHEITHATARHTGRRLEFTLFIAGAFKAASVGIAYFINTSYRPSIEKAKNEGNYSEVSSLESQRESIIWLATFVFDLIARFAKSGLSMHNSRSHELEADKYGMILLDATSQKGNQAGFTENSPQAAIWLQEFFAKHHDRSTHIDWLDWIKGLFSSHPDPKERVEANKATWQEIQKKRLTGSVQA